MALGQQQAALQHLARRRQEDSGHPVHLVHQHQEALVAVQHLERQRLDLADLAALAELSPQDAQQLQHQHLRHQE